MKDSLIVDLQQMGLTNYEAKVYLALLERKSLDTSEVSELSGVPRARSYDVLDSLVKRGLASLKPGKLKKYSALDIDTYKRKLLADARVEFKARENNIENISLVLKKKLESVFPPGSMKSEPLEYIEVLKEPHQVHRRFMQLFESARQEVLAFVKPPFSGMEELDEQVEQQKRIVERGVRSRSIYGIPSTKKEKKWLINYIKRVTEFGEEDRVVKEVPIKMVLFDDRTVLFALEDPILRVTSLTSLVIEHPSLVTILKVAFEALWNEAYDYSVLENNV